MVLFGKKWFYTNKVVVIRQKVLYSAKSGCIGAILVVFGQGGFFRAKWLYSGKSCCIREKVVIFGKSGYIRTM